MPRERSAGAIVFYQKGKMIEYLVLQYPQQHWDFPRGHVESGETDGAAALREVAEETQLKDLELIPGFQEKISWFYRLKDKKVNYKEAIYFLAQSPSKEVILSFEHRNFKWLPFDRALGQLTFDNTKKVFKKAHQYVLTNYRK